MKMIMKNMNFMSCIRFFIGLVTLSFYSFMCSLMPFSLSMLFSFASTKNVTFLIVSIFSTISKYSSSSLCPFIIASGCSRFIDPNFVSKGSILEIYICWFVIFITVLFFLWYSPLTPVITSEFLSQSINVPVAVIIASLFMKPPLSWFFYLNIICISW